MIQLEKINFSNHKSLPIVLGIYESSFPENERRTISNILRQIDYNSDYNFFVVLEDDFPVGMASVWVIDKRFIYIEHLCVDPIRRSKGIGSKAMNLLKDKSPFPIIIEVEKRLDTMNPEQANNCDRRLRFYDKHGFVLSEKEYMQPPYTPTLQAVPMNLMEAEGSLLTTDFDGVKNAIYKTVYKVSSGF
ncbi:MAG: GNAT family N-acetyltransferase [Paludibacteraceae bacterium]|nr:GNAT family N-acetyltransferase [Paludibacteraceae bacterium]